MGNIIICIRQPSQLKKFLKEIKLDQSNNNDFVFVVDIHSNDKNEYSKNYQNIIEELKKLKTQLKQNKVSVVFNSCYPTLCDSSKTEIEVTCLGIPNRTVLNLELFLSFFQNKVPTSNQPSTLLKPASEEEEKELKDLLETYKKLELVAHKKPTISETAAVTPAPQHALLAIAYAEHYPENKENFLQVAKKILETANDPIKKCLKELQVLLKKANHVEGGETNDLNLFTILKEHQNDVAILNKVLEYVSEIDKKKGEGYFWLKAIEVVDYLTFQQILLNRNSQFLQENDNLSHLIRYALSNRPTGQQDIINTIFDKAQDPETVFNIATKHLDDKGQKERLQRFYNDLAQESSFCDTWNFLRHSFESFKTNASQLFSPILECFNIPSFSPCNCCAKPAVDTTNEVRCGPAL